MTQQLDAGETDDGFVVELDSQAISAGNLSSTADFEPGPQAEVRGVIGANSAYISEVILPAP